MTTTKLVTKYGWSATVLFDIRRKYLTEGIHYERIRRITGHFEFDYTYSGIQAIKKYLQPRKCKQEGCTNSPSKRSPYCYDHSPTRKHLADRELSSTEKPGKFVQTCIGIEMREIMIPTSFYERPSFGVEQSLPPRRSYRE